jgi:hypothetical protein
VTGRRPLALACLALLLLVTRPATRRVDAGPEDEAWLVWRQGVERLFLEGRLEEVDRAMPEAPTALQAWPRLLRDRWWRRGATAAEGPAAPAGDPLLARRLAWLADGGVAPHPLPQGEEVDPWPVLTALVLDRQRRLGRQEDPQRVKAPELNALRVEDTYTGTILRQGLEKLDAYDGELAAASEEAWARSDAAAARTRRWAWILLAGLLAVAAVVGRRARSRAARHP